MTITTEIDFERAFLVGALDLTAAQASAMSISELRQQFYQATNLPAVGLRAQMDAIPPTNSKKIFFVTDEGSGVTYIDTGVWNPIAARGEIAYEELAADFGPSSSTAMVDVNVPVASFIANGRPVTFHVQTLEVIGTAGSIVQTQLVDTGSSTVIDTKSRPIGNSSAGFVDTHKWTKRFTPAPGNRNYKIQSRVLNNTMGTATAGTFTLKAGTSLQVIE